MLSFSMSCWVLLLATSAVGLLCGLFAVASIALSVIWRTCRTGTSAPSENRQPSSDGNQMKKPKPL